MTTITNAFWLRLACVFVLVLICHEPFVHIGQANAQASNQLVTQLTDGNESLLQDGSLLTWTASDTLRDGSDWITATNHIIKDVRLYAIGNRHRLAVVHDAELFGWGDGRTGALGNEHRSFTRYAVRITGLPTSMKMIQIAAGDAFSVVLFEDGSIWTWGSNGFGQLGDGSSVDHDVPTKVAELPSVQQFAVTDEAVIVRTAQGELWGWGRNDHGQLGDGTLVNHTLPIRLKRDQGSEMIACGSNHCVSLLENGQVIGWGQTDQGQLGFVDQTPSIHPVVVSNRNVAIRQVAAHEGTTTLLSEDGKVLISGVEGSMEKWSTVKAASPFAQIGTWSGVDTEDRLWSWQLQSSGAVEAYPILTLIRPDEPLVQDVVRLSNSILEPIFDPTILNYKASVNDSIQSTSLDVFFKGFTGTITVNNQLVTNGLVSNTLPLKKGENRIAIGLSSGITYTIDIFRGSPREYDPRNWKQIEACNKHQVGLTWGGDVYTWGGNEMSYAEDVIGWGEIWTPTRTYHNSSDYDFRFTAYGLLGRGDPIPSSASPVRLPQITGAVAISCSDFHNLALLENGDVMGWGDNRFDQLSHSDKVTFSVPILLTDVHHVKAVYAGRKMSIFLMQDGTLKGLGNVNESLEHLRNIRKVSIGQQSWVALDRSGRIWLGGSYWNGTEIVNHSFPKRIESIQQVKDVAMTNRTITAVKMDGTVWTWPENAAHFGANRSIPALPKPQLVKSIKQAIAIDSGTNAYMVLTKTGNVYHWKADLLEGQIPANLQTTPKPELINPNVPVTNISMGKSNAFLWNGKAQFYFWSGKRGANGRYEKPAKFAHFR